MHLTQPWRAIHHQHTTTHDPRSDTFSSFLLAFYVTHTKCSRLALPGELRAALTESKTGQTLEGLSSRAIWVCKASRSLLLQTSSMASFDRSGNRAQETHYELKEVIKSTSPIHSTVLLPSKSYGLQRTQNSCRSQEVKGQVLNTYWLFIRGLCARDLNSAVELQWSGLLKSALERQTQQNKYQEQVQPFLAGNTQEEVSVGMQKVVIGTKFLMLLKECTWIPS